MRAQVLDVLDVLFVSMFDGLSKDNAGLVETVFSQYPQEPFEYLPKSLRLTFAEGIAMLKEAGIDADPLGDLNTELERKLGKLVKVLPPTPELILTPRVATESVSHDTLCTHSPRVYGMVSHAPSHTYWR